jgi:transposase-like protein
VDIERATGMRCPACGAEMHLMKVAPDKTMMVPGYEEHTFECSGCHDHVRRLVFIPRARLSLSLMSKCGSLQRGSEVRSTARRLKVLGHKLSEPSHESTLCTWPER